MNKMIWRTAIVGGVMVAGLLVVPGSLSLNTWVAGPMISDPMDLNHLEAQGQHARWAAAVKAAKEAEALAAAKQAEAAAAEAARKAAEAAPAPRRTATPPKANTTPPRQAPPVQQAPPRDEWMETYNYWSPRLPGTWAIGDKGSWGAAVPDTGQVWIARRTPLYALKSVMLHEAGHVMQGRTFGGYAGAKAALGPYGGVEKTADCWALARGATWTNYGCDALARRALTERPF